jgi:RHS repeat-associated protein
VRYDYDPLNRLTQVTQPDNSTLTYVYDADGNRVKAVGPTGTTNYVVDPTTKTPEVVVETDGSGHIVASYTYGLGLISQRRSGVDSFYISDALGSTRALTNSAGVVTDRYSYDAFGQLLSSTGTTVNSFLYTGEQRDDAAGFYYLRARYYDSAIGRFLSQDPYAGSLQEPLSLQKYAYVQNNPVNRTDPTGLYGPEEGTAAHQVIGRYYIDVWGDWFVGKGKAANKGFGSRPGWGAYNRMIWYGDESLGFKPDLRNYITGDVYEIKPLTPYGIASAVPEMIEYTILLNIAEFGLPTLALWHPGVMSFPPLFKASPAGGPTLQAFAFPLVAPGAIYYTDDLARDLKELYVVGTAVSLGIIAVKRWLMVAPTLIQGDARARGALIQTTAPLLAFGGI